MGKVAMSETWEVQRFFVTRTRTSDDSVFVTLVDDAPDWVALLVQDCHDGELPNDWRYASCAHIAAALGDADGFDPDEVVDSLVDVGTFDLITWMGENLARVGDVDAANDDYGWAHDDGVVGMIRLGQSVVIRAMLGQWMDALFTWDEMHEHEFTCDVHEVCPDSTETTYSACYDAWKSLQFGFGR